MKENAIKVDSCEDKMPKVPCNLFRIVGLRRLEMLVRIPLGTKQFCEYLLGFIPITLFRTPAPSPCAQRGLCDFFCAAFSSAFLQCKLCDLFFPWLLDNFIFSGFSQIFLHCNFGWNKLWPSLSSRLTILNHRRFWIAPKLQSPAPSHPCNSELQIQQTFALLDCELKLSKNFRKIV